MKRATTAKNTPRTRKREKPSAVASEIEHALASVAFSFFFSTTILVKKTPATATV